MDDESKTLIAALLAEDTQQLQLHLEQQQQQEQQEPQQEQQRHFVQPRHSNSKRIREPACDESSNDEYVGHAH